MTNPRPTPPPAGLVPFSYITTICRVCGERGQLRNLPGEAPEHGSFVDGAWVPKHPKGSVNGSGAHVVVAPHANGNGEISIAPGEPGAATSTTTHASVEPDTRTTVELQRDLAVATTENARLRAEAAAWQSEASRWTDRVKLLESRLLAITAIAEGKRDP